MAADGGTSIQALAKRNKYVRAALAQMRNEGVYPPRRPVEFQSTARAPDYAEEEQGTPLAVRVHSKDAVSNQWKPLQRTRKPKASTGKSSPRAQQPESTSPSTDRRAWNPSTLVSEQEKATSAVYGRQAPNYTQWRPQKEEEEEHFPASLALVDSPKKTGLAVGTLFDPTYTSATLQALRETQERRKRKQQAMEEEKARLQSPPSVSATTPRLTGASGTATAPGSPQGFSREATGPEPPSSPTQRLHRQSQPRAGAPAASSALNRPTAASGRSSSTPRKAEEVTPFRVGTSSHALGKHQQKVIKWLRQIGLGGHLDRFNHLSSISFSHLMR